MKKTLKLLGVGFILYSSASMADSKVDKCEHQIEMGDLQKQAAAKEYGRGDLVEAEEHLRVSLFNYMRGFKPCMDTKYENILSSRIQGTTAALRDESFTNAVKLQKFLKAAKN